MENMDYCSPIVKKFLYYMLTIKGRSKNTVYSYKTDLNLFFKFLKVYYKLEKMDNFNNISTLDIDIDFIKKITISDVYEFLFFISKIRNNESKARARKVSCLKSFFKYLVYNEKVISENPIEGLESPKIKKSLPKYLDLEQSIQLLSNIDGDFKYRDFCILTFFLNCGFRLSELVSINLEDVSDNPIKIIGKGDKERQVYLNSSCLNALEKYLKIRKKIKSDSPALFLSKRKSRISKRRVQEIVENNLKKCGLNGYSTHKLRHTAATLMFQHGNVDVRTLQEILGHENLSTTQIYTHVSNMQIKRAFNLNPLSNVDMDKIKNKK